MSLPVRMRLRALLPVVCLVIATPLVVIACADLSDTSPPLRVFAAASLTDVVTMLAERYDAPVATSFGASSALARQIRDGAPADVFLSASPRWIEFLRQADAVAGEPVVVARNRLVAIAPTGSELAGTSVADARSLLDHLAPDDGVAIADEGVPAGEYARAALASLGLLEAIRPHLVGQSDVRAVLHAVAQGELRAGFVYATDARSAGDSVNVLFAFDPADHPPIEYQAAALRGAADAAKALDFLAYLHSDEARALVAGAGFALP